MGKPGNIFASWEENFVSAKMFPEVGKQGNIDRKRNVSATMFLVCPMPKSNRHSLSNVLSHVVLFAYPIKLNISTRNRVKISIKEVIL